MTDLVIFIWTTPNAFGEGEAWERNLPDAVRRGKALVEQGYEVHLYVGRW